MSFRMSTKALCEKTGMSRQNYYKGRTERSRRQVESTAIVDLVRKERCLQPRLGGKKVYRLLKSDFDDAGIKLGRDRFFDVLKTNGLLLDPLPKAPRTTNSSHCLPIFTNQLKDMEITHPNQAWVSDITYLRTAEGFMYLSLITDVFSRKIVGAHAGDSLEVQGCLNALNQAAGNLSGSDSPVHHSDRGSQYCSHLYVKKIKEYGLKMSMTEQNHCYENAMAERVNGILKQEYGLRNIFKTKKQALKAVKQAVYLYNYRRPHLALDYKTPAEVYQQAA